MDEKSFRVLLDLSELNLMSFKYIWMSIFPRDLKTIGDLKLSILRKLGFDRSDIRLFVHDGLLLEEEKIAVLRENDTVKVQYEDLSPTINFDPSSSEPLIQRILDLEKNLEELNEVSLLEAVQPKQKKRKSSIKACDCPELDPVPKKRKRKSNELNDAKEEKNTKEKVLKKKKKKQKISPVSPALENSVWAMNADCSETTPKSDHTFSLETINQTNDELNNCDTVPTKSKNKKPPLSPVIPAPKTPTVSCLENDERSALVSPNIPAASLDSAGQSNADEISENKLSTSADESLEISQAVAQGNNCKKKKRRRHRKRKSVPNLLAPFVSQPNAPESQKTESFDPCDTFASVRKHIRFASPTPETSYSKHVEVIDIDSYVAKHKSNSLKVSSNAASCSTPKSLSPLPVNKSPRVSTPFPVNNGYNSWTVSPMHSDSSYGTPARSATILSDMPENTSEMQPNECDIQNNSPSQLSYKDYPVLNVFPAVGTCIAYKMLELDESYSPVVSDFKEGKVVAVNTVSQELNIELNKVEIKPGRIGKFENLQDDEIPPGEVIQTVTVNWSSLIEPRLILKVDST